MYVIAVDDERPALENLSGAIRQAAPEALLHSFRYPEDALEYARENPVDVAFLDVEMPGMTGVTLAEKLKALRPEINIVFSTGYSHYRDAAFDLHASGYLTKPITAQKVKRELEDLRRPVRPSHRVRIRAFGNFEVYLDGMPMVFRYSKTRELLAYLVDRRGALCANHEILSVLFEDSAGHDTYLRSLCKDLTDVFCAAGCGDLITRQRGSIGIVPDLVDCDYFDWCAGRRSPDSHYRGEYMTQYTWSEYTNALLTRQQT